MYALIYNPALGGLTEFSNPVKTIMTSQSDQVVDCLEEVESIVKEHDGIAVGYLAYEAAPAFDKCFKVHEPQSPLLVFSIYRDYQALGFEKTTEADAKSTFWQPNITEADYAVAISSIKDAIREGDTYQVNYTFKLKTVVKGDCRSLFLGVQSGLKAEYAAYIELDEWAICSFSPELFFSLNNGRLISKPMKGTAKRGLTEQDDQRQKDELSESRKNRAENIMIVDMIRNDMGRIADIGSVAVEKQFELERHPYVWQMTSTVAASVETSVTEIFKGLFPCASITGAPKISTMEIINRLEKQPRGIYTGGIGYFTANGDARFNVAIRTLVVDRRTGNAEYGVGSGIVWDSKTEDEYEECLMKADFLNNRQESFKIFESMLWTPQKGYFILQEHLERLEGSAEYFGFPFELSTIQQKLEQYESTVLSEGAKVKLLLASDGGIEIESSSLAGVKSDNLKIGLAKEAVDSTFRFLYHKTTVREIYDNAKKQMPEFDDIIFWNEKEEITESTRANVVAEIDGELVTPPVSCGLLAGTFRRKLLEEGKISEKVISVSDLKMATKIFTINSVRCWMSAYLAEE